MRPPPIRTFSICHQFRISSSGSIYFASVPCNVCVPLFRIDSRSQHYSPPCCAMSAACLSITRETATGVGKSLCTDSPRSLPVSYSKILNSNITCLARCRASSICLQADGMDVLNWQETRRMMIAPFAKISILTCLSLERGQRQRKQTRARRRWLMIMFDVCLLGRV